MISLITKNDISLVKKLASVRYETRGMLSSVPTKERNEFLALRKRLKSLSDFFKQKYDNEYGLFQSARSSGNPVGRGGDLRRVWSGIFKGSDDKQYSAQVSFVINGIKGCLEVGFYFGRASAFNLTKKERTGYESELKSIGAYLLQAIRQDIALRKRFYELFEIGFRAEVMEETKNPEQWLENADVNPKHSSITMSLYPNPFGYIDLDTIDFHVAQVIPLLGVIPEKISNSAPNKKRRVNALTPEQRAQKAERLALIGLEGEKYIMAIERERLAGKKSVEKQYPYHVSLYSDNEGYDILSYEQGGEEIYIEVKTTTFDKSNPLSKTFFLSSSEYKFYQQNKSKYRLYRVWDIFGDPSYEEINLENVDFVNDGFRVTI